MIQDKIFFDEKDPTGLSYNTPFTYYGSYQGRLWSKAPGGEIKYYTQNSDLSVYATTGSNQFSGSQTITGSLTVTGTITGTVAGTTATASYVEYTNVANKPALISGSSQVTYSGLTGIPSGIVSGSAQIASFGIFATTGSNGFNGSQSITGSLTVTGQVVAQTLNVQQVTSSVVYSSGSNVFGNSLSNTQQFTGSLQVTGSTHYLLGNVGVGVTNPLSRLHVNTGTDQNFRVRPGTDVGATNGVALNSRTDDDGSLQQLTLRASDVIMLTSGNVGIGTASPTNYGGFNTLHINGKSDTGGGVLRLTSFDASAGVNIYAQTGGIFFNTTTASPYVWLTADTERMRLTHSGNVGIGITSPSTKLHVYEAATNSTAYLTIQNNRTRNAAVQTTTTNGSFLAGTSIGTDTFNYQIYDGVAGSARLTISSTGAATFSSSVTADSVAFIGQVPTYGTDFAQFSHSSRAGANQYSFLSQNNGGTYVNSHDSQPIYFRHNNSNLAIITSGGNVGIGTSSPSARLHVSGTVEANGSLYRAIFGGAVQDADMAGLSGGNGSEVQIQAASSTRAAFLTLGGGMSTSEALGGIAFYNSNNTDGKRLRGYLIAAQEGATTNEQGGYLAFGTAANAATTPTERMRITSGGVVRINGFTSNGLVGTDASGNLGVVNNTYTEIATGTITYSMTSGYSWGINNSFPATIRNYEDDLMAGSAGGSTALTNLRGVTFDLGSAKAVRKIVERGYSTKNLDAITVQYSTDNSNWTTIHTYRHVYGNVQKNMEFNPTGAISARYWRWLIDGWTETREVQNYYTYESIIYT